MQDPACDQGTYLLENGEKVIPGSGHEPTPLGSNYEVVSNQTENGHVHDQPRRTQVVDSIDSIELLSADTPIGLVAEHGKSHYGWIEPRRYT